MLRGRRVISLSLPFPPTTNTLYRTAGASRDGKRKGRIKTQRYLTWLRAAGNEVLAQKQRPVSGEVVLLIQLGRPDKRRRDISNCIKAVEDLLVEHCLIEDDSMVIDLRIKWNDYLEKGDCRVVVWPAIKEQARAAA